MTTIASLVLALVAAPGLAPQAADAPSATQVAERSFADVPADAQRRLEESLAELAALREEMAAEKIPLARRISELEGLLVDARGELQSVSRLLDSRTLDLSNLRTQIKARQEETGYLSTLLGEYLRNFESGLHIAELQRYRKDVSGVRLAMENETLSEAELFAVQAGVLDLSLARLEEALGGTRFAGSAADAEGLMSEGTFVLLGPAAVFRSNDGARVGTAEQRLGSLEPAVIVFEDPKVAEAASQVAAATGASFPLDPTLGNAHKIAATEETLLEHIAKGGPVMYPILGMAGLALLVALYKWLRMSLIFSPSRKRVRELLAAVAKGDKAAATAVAARMPGPQGRMLRAGAEHLGEPRELVEEIMFETVLASRHRINSLLPFIAICAAAAPLLGLLGTVTGIMNTFKLITVFGTGDVKTLSGGISEALITTEFGLIVAIPSLLLHAYLSRKAKGIVDRMEATAIRFVNEVAKFESHAAAAKAAAPSARKPEPKPEPALATAGAAGATEAEVKPS
jgi:biopolymer transport protein ExbB